MIEQADEMVETFMAEELRLANEGGGTKAVTRGALAAAFAMVERDRATAGHDYLSTGCLHGEHDYCSSMTGLTGSKRPAQCKFCAARCRCDCHGGKP